MSPICTKEIAPPSYTKQNGNHLCTEHICLLLHKKATGILGCVPNQSAFTSLWTINTISQICNGVYTGLCKSSKQNRCGMELKLCSLKDNMHICKGCIIPRDFFQQLHHWLTTRHYTLLRSSQGSRPDTFRYFQTQHWQF